MVVDRECQRALQVQVGPILGFQCRAAGTRLVWSSRIIMRCRLGCGLPCSITQKMARQCTERPLQGHGESASAMARFH